MKQNKNAMKHVLKGVNLLNNLFEPNMNWDSLSNVMKISRMFE
jgi:hypothetical protein